MSEAPPLIERIADAAGRCRDCQTVYFRSRSLADLRASKGAESTLDRLLVDRAAAARGERQASIFSPQGN